MGTEPQLGMLGSKMRGYRARELTSDVYPDVRPAIERWKSRALVVAIYSSGSALAQRLLFAHTHEGDLTPLFSGFFDTPAQCASWRKLFAPW